MTKKKLTFKQWLKGEFAIKGAPLLIGKKIEKKLVIVEEIEISKDEIKKIKKEQNLIFDKGINELSQIWKNSFLKRYKNSKTPQIFLQEQINTINSILFDPLPKIHHNDDFVTINELPFQYNRLQEIKVYAWDIIIQGKEFNYNVIHSPNYKHSLDGYQDAIYAQAMFNHLKWLSNLNEDLGKDKKLLELKWFKVGLLFANGEMDSLFEKHKSGDTPNFTAVARELGDKNLRPYISESYSGTNETDKNIFINKDKVEKILNYCKTNNINVLETFNERIKY